jgi:predicted ArsR family transcriptional regulator
MRLQGEGSGLQNRCRCARKAVNCEPEVAPSENYDYFLSQKYRTKGDEQMKDRLYERAKNRVQLAAYFAREMIQELGKEKALDIIGAAYQKYSNDHLVEPYLDVPLEKRFEKLKENLKSEAAADGHLTVTEESDRHIKVRFNRCPYYEVYRDYGIPEVCRKYCDGDFEAFRKVHPGLRVTREHEIAYGDSCCDHCWTMEEMEE